MLFIRPAISPRRSPTLDSFVRNLAAEDIARQREKVIDILGRNPSGRLILEACKNLDIELGILRKSWLTLPEDDPRCQLVFTILDETKFIELDGKNKQMQQHFDALQNTLEGQDLLRHQQLWEIEWKRKAAKSDSIVEEQQQGQQTEMLHANSRSMSCQDLLSSSSLARVDSARRTRPRSNTAPSGSCARFVEPRRRRKPKLTLKPTLCHRDILFEPRPASQPLPCFPRAIFEHPGTSTHPCLESIQSLNSQGQDESPEEEENETESNFADDSSDPFEDVDEPEKVEREDGDSPCCVFNLGARPTIVSLPLALMGAIGIVLALICIGLLSSVQMLVDRLDDVRGRGKEVKS